MYNDPRAKDLLAQYPRQLAEGGAVDQPFQAPAVAPRGAPLPAAAANQSLAVAPRQRPVLAPVENTLSMSQQFARDRAAQDAMIRDAIRNTGVTNPSTMDYRQLQRAVRAGDITGENIKQKFVDPELEARVRNAYAAIGRTGGVVPALEMPKQGGATADTYKQVRQDEYNYWADQLKQGKISPADFQNAFLTKAATDIPTTDLEAQRDYVNKARKALGMADLEVPKKRNAGIGYGPCMGGMGGTQNQYGTGNLKLNKLFSVAKKAVVPKEPTKPIDLSGTGSTPVQLFDEGGEAVAGRDPRSMDLEQFLLENSRMQAGPVDVQEVRSARGPGKYDTRISKDEGGFQAFADVDVGDKKLSQVGASFVGRGRIGNYEVQYVFDPETKQPVITGAIRKELSPTSDVSAEGVYVPQKDGKDYYNAGVRYTKRFEDGGPVDKFDAEILANTRLSPDYYAEADKGVIVEKATGKALKDFDKRIAEQSLGTNVAVDPSRYIRKDDTVFPYSERLTVHGWVDPAKPDQVHIQADPGEKYKAFLKRIKAKDKNMQSTFDRVSDKPSLNTLVHEMTHSNQIREAFLPESEYKKKLLLAERYNKAVGIKNDIDNEAYYNPMTGSGLGEKELGAYLNSYEGIHPSAKTVDGKQVVVPFEKSYLGKQMLPPAKGLLKLIEDMGGFTYYGSAQDPETLKYVNKMMGREKRKPTSKK